MEKKEFETEKLCANARSIVADYKYASPGDNIVIASDISDNFVIIQKL
jgi:hypothetical protein